MPVGVYLLANSKQAQYPVSRAGHSSMLESTQIGQVFELVKKVRLLLFHEESQGAISKHLAK